MAERRSHFGVHSAYFGSYLIKFRFVAKMRAALKKPLAIKKSHIHRGPSLQWSLL